MTEKQERDTEREAFEVWAREMEYDLRACCELHPSWGDTYVSRSTENAWRTWRAARSQQQQQAAEALRAARDCILLDRTALADTHMNPATNTGDEDGQAGLDEYDAVLAKIDAALSDLTGGGNG